MLVQRLDKLLIQERRRSSAGMGMYATRRGVQGLRQQSVMSTPNRGALWIQGVMTTFSRATPSSVRSTALGLRHVELLARAMLAVMKGSSPTCLSLPRSPCA